MCHDIFLIDDWFYLFFFFCKIIFFFRESNSFAFSHQRTKWKYRADHVIWRNFHANEFLKDVDPYNLCDTTCNFASSTSTGKMMIYSLRASKSHLSWRQIFFLRSPLFFTIVMITVYWQKALRIFLRINRGSFRILRIFCFESFFGTYNVYFYIASNFFRISTFHKVRARRLLELGSELKNAIISQMIFKLLLWVLYLLTQKQWKFDIAKRHHCQTMLL